MRVWRLLYSDDCCLQLGENVVGYVQPRTQQEESLNGAAAGSVELKHLGWFKLNDADIPVLYNVVMSPDKWSEAEEKKERQKTQREHKEKKHVNITQPAKTKSLSKGKGKKRLHDGQTLSCCGLLIFHARRDRERRCVFDKVGCEKAQSGGAACRAGATRAGDQRAKGGTAGATGERANRVSGRLKEGTSRRSCESAHSTRKTVSFSAISRSDVEITTQIRSKFHVTPG